MDILQGERNLGFETIEKGLPVGSVVTALGALSKSSHEDISQLVPSSSGIFILTRKTFQDYLKDKVKYLKNFFFLSSYFILSRSTFF